MCLKSITRCLLRVKLIGMKSLLISLLFVIVMIVERRVLVLVVSCSRCVRRRLSVPRVVEARLCACTLTLSHLLVVSIKLARTR